MRSLSFLSKVLIVTLFVSSIYSLKARAIIGGEPVTVGNPISRFTVALLDGDGNFVGSGILISKTKVLTAAHLTPFLALKPFTKGWKPAQVAFSLSLEGAALENLNLVREVTPRGIEVHENWNWKNADFPTIPQADIAILTLKEEAPPGFEPIGIYLSRDGVIPGIDVILAGYGETQEDLGDQGTLHWVRSRLNGVIPETKEIENGPTPGRDTCYGDSGGPLLVEKGGVFSLLGIVSRPLGGGCSGSGRYTDVLSYLDWINHRI